ncbi:hypothetical protein [Pseudorhodobacter aquimaris]|uniref:hypothetical protein n=1 Tax=Pseudorhodobacter aquimaris TaxID=687412 RepID=UPI0012ED1794|nr:hypothetical protein [Pseudorhodobacter aquimaris]
MTAEVHVRVLGIDAPDVPNDGCPNGVEFEKTVTDWVEKTYPVGKLVRLENVQRGAFAGRVVADIKRFRSDRWLSLADELLARKYAVEWKLGQSTPPWCLLAPE